MDKHALNPQLTVLARAIYDNNAEVPQEISFSRGDILTVIKKDPEGFEGWWICSLNEKVGIVPGNRLEILGAITPKKTALPEPYDILPLKSSSENGVDEQAPASPTTSVYANCYENFPSSSLTSDSTLETFAAQVRTPPPVRKSISHSVSLTFPKVSGGQQSSREEAVDSSSGAPIVKSDTFQSTPMPDDLQRKSVKRSGSSHNFTAGRPTVRFAEQNDSVLSPSSSFTSSSVRSSAASNNLEGCGVHPRHAYMWGPCSSITSPENSQKASIPRYPSPPPPPPPILNRNAINDDSFGSSRSSSSDYSRSRDGLMTASRPNILTSWSTAQTRINLLITEMLSIVNKQKVERSNSQFWLLKLHQFEQGLFPELTNLQVLINATLQIMNSEENQLKPELEAVKMELKRGEDDLAAAFHLLHESDGQMENLLKISTEIQRITPLLQHLFELIQENWKAFTESKSAEAENLNNIHSTLYEDRIATLTRPAPLQENPGIESTDPEDLLGLFTVYSAQLHSHCILIRETADEFLSSIHGNIRDPTPKHQRGYTLPSAGVLVAHAKFLLRCSSQLVNLAANFCAALLHTTFSSDEPAINLEQVRIEVESAGNSVCESLKGLITQTKEVAGLLATTGLDFTPTNSNPSKPVVSGPEMERLVGSIIEVVTSTNSVKLLVAKYLSLLNRVGASSSQIFCS